MKDSRLEIVLSDKLKQQFKAVCDESEMSMSNKARELIANLVRNYKRELAKGNKVDS